MKLRLFIKTFIILATSVQVYSQNINLSVTGHVFEINTGAPISNQNVTLNINGNGLINTYEFDSNEQGYWGSDSLSGYMQGTVQAVTYDCNGQIHEFQENYNPALNTFVFDFYICHDTLPGNDCANWFQYSTNDNWTFQFTGEVFPPGPANYSWDFGDGSIGFGQQATHIFEPAGVLFYTVCLTTYSSGLSGDSCIAVSCQDVYVGGQGGDCINWFWTEQINSTTYQFHGESSPYPADVYSWNFGDGQGGWGQDVTHSFDPGLGEQFLVQLTTFSYDPVSADSCTAFSEQWIYIGNSSNCEANFYYLPDSLQPIVVHFYDNSTGNITSRLWDFGDGLSSTETNPVHTFTGPGNYNVCLTITSDSLGTFCTDTYCAEINLQAELTAGFSFTLDTLSGLTRNYYFIDNSMGEPDSWIWDFGDSGYSSSQSPVHQFTQAGTFNVCLQISKSFPNGGTLTDDYCHEIIPPSYFDIGGLAFIGNTPINNPISTGDTGVAYLYRRYNDAVVPVDTNYFYEYGYYWFSDVREGNHIVKVGLTENSEHFASFVPAYYPDHLYWEDAEILQVNDTNNYFVDIYLPELPGAITGPGMIYGNIVDMPNPSMSDYVVGQPVFLYNSADDLLAYCISSSFGNFAFENLAFGTYKLTTDVTGFYGDPITITIDQVNPSFYNALLEIYESPPNEIPENNFTVYQASPVYPNPLTDKLNLDVISVTDFNLKATIYNLSGQKILEDEFMIFAGTNTLSISTSRLESGLYFITIRSDEVKVQNTYKFLKNK
jgi:PKD repeat protein